MAHVESDGIIRFYVDLTIEVNELSTWTPERIMALFTGLAAVRAALRPQRERVPGQAEHGTAGILRTGLREKCEAMAEPAGTEASEGLSNGPCGTAREASASESDAAAAAGRPSFYDEATIEWRNPVGKSGGT
jgi:hypothetical protein